MEISEARKIGNANLKSWKPGESGNPAGKPKGTLDFKTVLARAIKKIASDKTLDLKDPETAMVVKAYQEALKGDFKFYKDITDRAYGKAQDQLDITSGGKPLPLLNNVHNDQSDTQTAKAEETD